MESLKDKVPGLLGIIYVIGQPITFIALIMMDAENGTRGFVAWAVAVVVDLFLATIWPIYWGALHWLPRLA
jgi:hypothetical protein